MIFPSFSVTETNTLPSLIEIGWNFSFTSKSQESHFTFPKPSLWSLLKWWLPRLASTLLTFRFWVWDKVKQCWVVHSLLHHLPSKTVLQSPAQIFSFLLPPTFERGSIPHMDKVFGSIRNEEVKRMGRRDKSRQA
jgi:hypothetical protein